MNTDINKLLNIVKKVFSIKVLLIFSVFVLTLLNLFSYNNFIHLKIQNKSLQEKFLLDISLIRETSNIEGTHIGEIELTNLLGKKLFNSFFNNDDYIIIIYQNGLVCDPCMEFFVNYWIINKNSFDSDLSKEMIIVNNTIDGLVLRYLKSVHMENSFYYDSTNYIHDNIVKIDKPTNFLLFVDKSGEIIYSSYFDTDSKVNLISFINKVNRFLSNNTSKITTNREKK